MEEKMRQQMLGGGGGSGASSVSDMEKNIKSPLINLRQRKREGDFSRKNAVNLMTSGRGRGTNCA